MIKVNKAKTIFSIFPLRLEENIIYMTVFQVDKLILLTINYLIIVNAFEKKIITKIKIKKDEYYNTIKIYENNKIILFKFDISHTEKLSFFELTENNNNYDLKNIGVIEDRTKDVFVYKNSFILMKDTHVAIYTYKKNKLFQLQTNIFFYNQQYKIIMHPYGKNLGIFQKNDVGGIILSELNKNYKIMNTSIIKGLNASNVCDLIYEGIKSNNKSNNKFLLAYNNKIFLFSSSGSDFKLIEEKKVIFVEEHLIRHIFVTKSGDIYVSNDSNNIVICYIRFGNIVFNFDRYHLVEGEFFNVCEKNEKKIFITANKEELNFFELNVIKYYIIRYFIFLTVTAIILFLLLFFGITSFNILLALILMLWLGAKYHFQSKSVTFSIILLE